MPTYIDNLSKEMQQKYDPDMFIGFMCWYYVPGDVPITLRDWIAAIVGTSLSNMVPTAPRAVDGMKRAMNGHMARIEDDGFIHKVLARESGKDDEKVYRTLVVEKLDAEEQRLFYEEVIKFTYDRDLGYKLARGEGDISKVLTYEKLVGFTKLSNVVAGEIENRVYAIIEKFKRELGSLGAIKIREMLRKDIEGNQRGVLVRESGGVYFVFSANDERLHALDELVTKLGNGCQFHLLPIMDDGKQREMLRAAFEAESAGEVDRLMDYIRELKAGKRGKITMHKAQGVFEEFRELQGRLADYSDHLEIAMDETAARLTLLNTQAMSLFKEVQDK